jgi:hypothetical protein
LIGLRVDERENKRRKAMKRWMSRVSGGGCVHCGNGQSLKRTKEHGMYGTRKSSEFLVIIVIIGFLVASAYAGDGPMFPGAMYRAPEYQPLPQCVAASDLNGDQVADLAVAYSHTNEVAVRLALGNGAFGAPILYAVGNAPQSVAIGDLNGDGKPDLAVATNGAVSVLLGWGDGTFGAPADFGTYGSSVVAIADLDGDTKPDVAVATNGGVSVLLGQGDGTLDPAVLYSGARGDCDPRSMAIADLDGDGDLDLAVPVCASYGKVQLFRNQGDGTFANAGTQSADYYPYSMALADLNGDEKLDLVIANSDSRSYPTATLTVRLGNGDLTFGPRMDYPLGDGNRGAYHVAIGDFNRDDVPDVAVVIVDAHCVVLVQGLGDGTLGTPVSYYGGYRPRSVAIADLDGDDVLDLAVAHDDENLYDVWVLLGVGDGSMVAPRSYAVGDDPRGVAIGDLDGDGVPDLAVANLFSDSVSVLLGTGDGGFAPAIDYSVGYRPASVAIGDLDGDGDLDLALPISDYDRGKVSLLLNQGDGTFGAALPCSSSPEPRFIAIGDLNGDDIPDLVVAHGYNTNAVSVYLGLGGGAFAPRVLYAAGWNPAAIAIGDLNGDNVPDLAVANGEQDNVSVLLGLGDGTFAGRVNYRTGDSEAISIAIADLNADGVADMAAGHSSSGEFSVLLGLGDGTFADAVHYPSGGYRATCLAIGDLNADDVPDLVGTTYWGAVCVLLGLGDGTFAEALRYASGGCLPWWLAIGDLDGNGLLDLAVANLGINQVPDNVAVLLNQGMLNEPPVIACEAPVVLWSPDHELVDVGSAFTVTDPDEDPVALSFRVISDESEVPETGDGTGRHAPDFKTQLACGDEGLFVRSERRGPGDGRFYIFVITADDGNGGVTTQACVAAVCPHDQDEESLAYVLAQAQAAAADVQNAIDTLGVETLNPSDLDLYEHGLSDELGPHQ